MNFPNQVTTARLVLTVVLFVLLHFGWYATSFWLFLVAASTDWLDGYWARKYGQVTQLGRILDPFADKLIICGSFIYLAAAPQLADGSPASGIAAWVAVLILARELIVTALRSFIEQSGGDFSAKWSGKLKMGAQCAAAACSLWQLASLERLNGAWTVTSPPWLRVGLAIAVWLTVLLTVYSGLEYALAAWRWAVGAPSPAEEDAATR
jgi:CDP-diacylglycerol--glycerol-3-phosphate 3-phosphatidyltransferase